MNVLLCVDWTDASIIAAFVESGIIILTSISSILMVFCQINKQKEVENRRHKAQLLEDCYSIVLANMDSVIHSYETYNVNREKNPPEDTEKNWGALQTLTLPLIEDAVKMLNKVEVVVFSMDYELSSVKKLEDNFSSSIRALNKGDEFNKDAYTKAKEEFKRQVEDLLKKLS